MIPKSSQYHTHSDLQQHRSVVAFGDLWKKLLASDHREVACRCSICGATLTPAKPTLYVMAILDALTLFAGAFWGWIAASCLASSFVQAVVILVLALLLSNVAFTAIEAAVLIHLYWESEPTNAEARQISRKLIRKWYSIAHAIALTVVLALFAVIFILVLA